MQTVFWHPPERRRSLQHWRREAQAMPSLSLSALLACCSAAANTCHVWRLFPGVSQAVATFCWTFMRCHFLFTLQLGQLTR
jgi:hypothetical protein